MIDQYSSLSEKFLRKWFWLYLFGFIIAPIWYIIKIILSQDLSVSEIGILYWVISIVTLLSAFSDFWIRESLSYFIPRYNEKKDYDSIKTILFFGFILQCITGWIIFVLLFFGSTYIAQNYFENDQAIFILKVFSFFFLWINLFQLINNFFMAVQNTFLQKITEFLRMLFVMISVLWIFVFDMWSLAFYSYSWIFWLYLWVWISLIVFFTKYYKKYLKHNKILFQKDFFYKVFSYSSITFLSVQSFVILSQVDMQMVLFMLGTKDAWFYTNYLSIVWIPNVILGPIFFLLYPIFSELDEKKEHQKIRNIKYLFQKNFLILSFSFSVLFFIFSKEMSIVFFWEKFITSGIILQYSILFIAWNFLLRVNHMLLASIWRIHERLYIVIFSIFMNILLNYIFIKIFGVAWAALATGISWIIIWGITESLLKNFRVRFDYKYIIKNTIYLWCLWCILIMIKWYLDTENISRWILLFFVGLISSFYFILFFILNISDVKNFMREIKNIRKS